MVILIAHRLRIVTGVDNIIVLDNGEIFEIGNHESFMKKEGMYDQLFSLQQKTSNWTL